ncbi:MAG: thioredoxin fold domain-containing protein [Candidatus Accumulibacter sp.]|jgi:protein SCO1/2|nr:thioredoxin fold domain-containing protein [Accumulibacter sp.]
MLLTRAAVSFSRAFGARFALFLLFLLFFPGAARAALFDIEAQDLATELSAARRGGRRLAVFFELPDCPNCLKMKRDVFSDRKAAKRFGRVYRAVRINLASPLPIADARGQKSSALVIAESCRVYAVPSFAFFDREGGLEYRHMGGLSHASELLRLGRYVSEAIYEERSFHDYLSSFSKH